MGSTAYELLAALGPVAHKPLNPRHKAGGVASALTSLFRTLLHQLMTAQFRVSDLDVESLLSQAVPEPNAAQP